MSSAADTTARVRVPRPYQRRRRIRRVVAVVLVGGVASATAIAVSVLIAVATGAAEVQRAALIGWVIGSAATAASVSMMPLIRWASGRSAEARLLQAASPAHPLLRALMLNAPGTYAHSVAVANLAETAADELGANALLARVGAYYHDIGKISAACWFFENLQSNQNPHDGRTPAESVRIITQHVADGEQLARSYHLPREVEEIVRQHHGTSLVRYFYHKAASEDAGVFEGDFRYPAEKPSSREAGLVMLADASEAAVRAMSDHSHDRVEEAVRAVIAEKVADGQLAECGLTDGDVQTVVDTYTDMLTSMYHSRCEYPSFLREGA